MYPEASQPVWSRRAFLSRAGFGGLAAASLTALSARPAAGAVEQNAKLVITWSSFDTMDPHVKQDVSAAAFNLNIYDNLVRYQGNPPEIVPWLAESHAVSNDGKTWTFYLRQGVQFHDGSEVNAEAVRFSFERLLTLGKAPAAIFKRMGLTPEKVRAIAPYTVEIQLERSFGPFLETIPTVSIVNPAVITAQAENGDWAEKWLLQNAAGCGAFQLSKADPATGFTMTRFPGYWRGWEGQHVETVEVRIIREQSSRVLALMKGDVHYIETLLGPDQLEKLEKHPRVKVSREESMRMFVIRMHNQREPFTDINVRKAFSHAFNYESFITDMMKGRVARNPVPIPRPLWGYPKEVMGYEYSLDKAKAYLAKAQIKITRPIDIYVQAPNEPTVQAALLLQSDLAQLGIELRIVKTLFTSIVAATKTVESTPDMWIHWISTYFVDPENWIGEMYDSANGGTWKASSWYNNPQVDALLRQARSLIDREARAKLYADACHLLLEDAPDLWVYNTYEYVPLAKTVQGFRFCLVGSGQDFWPVYFDGRA
jgi:peptide/nickel transport system substrate-binding protein